ncbi:Fc.00g110620.m01.CDS01 [Cosmosporella sp. VM-42]
MDPTTSNKVESTGTSSTSSNTSSYFSLPVTTTSKGSTPETTPLTTPGGHPIPALLREFPKPAGKLDVETMLSRQPGRWTLQGQMEANMRRTQAQTDNEELEAKRARDFEKAKRDLLASHEKLRTRGSGDWR